MEDQTTSPRQWVWGCARTAVQWPAGRQNIIRLHTIHPRLRAKRVGTCIQMQFRSTAKAGMHSDFHHRAPQEVARSTPNSAPPSTAWLAAQQAFLSHRPAPAAEPVVTVRRGRALALAVPSADEAQAATPAPEMANKPARIFRITSAVADSNAALQARSAQPSLQTGFDLSRQGRIASNKRPGPVLRIVPAAPAVAEPEAQTQKESVGALREMLAEIDAILEDIKAARAFRFSVD